MSGTQPLQPRAEVAVGLIVAEDGRLLLQHREDKPGLPGANLWGFFGGHIEPGERTEMAFLREMSEELGWRPRHFELFTTREVDSGGWRLTSHVFAAHLDVSLSLLTLGEGQAMALHTPGAIPATTTTSVRPVIAEFAASRAYERMRHAWPTIAAAALLVDRGGRFLLQHRDGKPGIANPGMWGSFGGEVEPYETPQDGFLRELREEISWQPHRFELYRAYPYDAAQTLIYVFMAPIDVPVDQLVLGEGQGMAFFAPRELPTNTIPDLRRLIERFATTDAYRSLTRG
jgi:mutator protein MutT